MKPHTFLLFAVLLLSSSTFAQTRKGTYGSAGIGYGSYTIDLYSYAGGSNLYSDQHFSGPLISLGVEKKSAWTVNKLVFDIGGDLTGGFGISSDATSSGYINSKGSGGYLVGIKGLVKMGYQFSDNEGSAIPTIGLGPYYNYINSGGSEGEGNYIYGLQGSIGVDFPMKKLLFTPEIHFGLASWGSSDEMDQNGQPGFFEIRVKVAKRF